VRTIEIVPAHAEFARNGSLQSDVAGRVEVIEGAGNGRAEDVRRRLGRCGVLDADKKSYPLYLTRVPAHRRRGGLIMVDNAFAFERAVRRVAEGSEVSAVRSFNEHMSQVEGLQSVIVPLGDGVWVGVRR
jgi:predicted O-methyltransferase YrrM